MGGVVNARIIINYTLRMQLVFVCAQWKGAPYPPMQVARLFSSPLTRPHARHRSARCTRVLTLALLLLLLLPPPLSHLAAHCHQAGHPNHTRQVPALEMMCPVMIESSDVVLLWGMCVLLQSFTHTCFRPRQDVKRLGSGVDKVPRVLVWAPTP